MSQTLTVTTNTFEADVLNSETPVLVDFWADWCGPCKALTPVLDKIAADYADRLVVAKVNVDEEQQIASAAGIQSLPTMMLFVGGQPVDQIVGAQPDANIRAVIDRHVTDAEEPDSDAPPELPPLNDDSDPEAAIAKLRTLLDEQPENPEAHAAIARIMVVNGWLDQARNELAELPETVADTPAIAQVSAALYFAEQNNEIATPETDIETRFANALKAAIAGEHDEAAELLLSIMAEDRSFADDAARKGLLKLIDLLGADDPRAGALRRRMMTIIY